MYSVGGACLGYWDAWMIVPGTNFERRNGIAQIVNYVGTIITIRERDLSLAPVELHLSKSSTEIIY